MAIWNYTMEYSTLAIEAALLILITMYAYFVYWKYKDFPPGPYGIPLLGYAPFLGAKPHVTLTNLAEKYGRILSANLGNSQTVIINDWEGIREMLVKQGDTFGRRPYVYTFEIMMQGRDNDIVTANGPVNKELKRVSTKILKEFGMGRSSLESVVVTEVEKLATHLTTLDGQLVDVSEIFFIPVMNIVWGITSGNAFDLNDSEMQSFADAVHTVAGLSNIGILSVFPFLRFIAPELTGYTTFDTAAKKIIAYMDKIVDRHFDDEDGPQTDFIHVFIEEIKHRKKSSKDQPPYCKSNLSGATYDMFVAGIESTDTTLFWGLLLMAYHPDIQAKVQRELDEAIPKDSHVSYSSRTMIPYTEATLCEVLRFATILPFSVPHCAAKDATLSGYKIPKGTTVLPNIWALNHDKEYWGDPDQFRPDRFLDEEGRLKKHDRFIPFSAGPRVCLGEPLAKLELTMFFSCLMRRFSFQMDPNRPKSASVLEPNVGIVLRPYPISLLITCR